MTDPITYESVCGGSDGMRRAIKIKIEAERPKFEAAGSELHGWGERDYEMNRHGEYTWLEVRRAFALWIVARRGAVEAPQDERLLQLSEWVDKTGVISKHGTWYPELQAIVTGRAGR